MGGLAVENDHRLKQEPSDEETTDQVADPVGAQVERGADRQQRERRPQSNDSADRRVLAVAAQQVDQDSAGEHHVRRMAGREDDAVVEH
jgi:hypothetical protein